MKLRKQVCPLAALMLCLGAAPHAAAQEPLRSAPVRVFDATELTPDRYTVVKRIWVESWRSAFSVPHHADSGAAIGALTAEAARLGADAVTHLICLNDQRAWLDRGYFCYGLAVKLK